MIIIARHHSGWKRRCLTLDKGWIARAKICWTGPHCLYRQHCQHHHHKQGRASREGLDGQAEGCEQGLKQAGQGGGEH